MAKQDEPIDLERLKLEQEAKRLDLMERQMALQELQAKTMQTQVERTTPRENANYIVQGIFTKPNGEQWNTDLKCEMFFGPIKLNKTPLSEAEVVALNRIQPVEKAPITKVDGSTIRITVRPEFNAVGDLARLTMDVPMKKDDNPQHYPILTDFAQQLANAADAVAA